MMSVKGILGMVLGALTVACGAGLLVSASYLITLSAMVTSVGALTLPIVAVRFFGVGRAVCRYGERYLTHAAVLALGANLRKRLYCAVERLPYDAWQKPRSEVARTLVFDIETIEQWSVRALSPALVAAVTYLVGGGVLFLADHRPALVYLVGASLIALVGIASARWTQDADEAAERAKEQVASDLSELTLGLVDARLSGAEHLLCASERDSVESLRRAQRRTGDREAIALGLSELILYGTVWLIFVIACVLVTDGYLAGVWLAAVTLGASACLEGFLPLAEAARYHRSVSRAKAHLRRLADAPLSVPGTSRASMGDIRFDRVSYEVGSRRIIDNVSFTVRSGEHIAIVGASGSGKTTLMHLLCGYLRPTGGRITIGGVDVGELAYGEIERLIGAIPQEIDLFAGTLADNVRLADPTSHVSRLETVWQESELTLLDPMRTLTALGRELSGGERQRIAIARYLLVSDRPIAVWDEPLSHLSADMAERIDRRLVETRRAKTLIAITHRLDHASNFDAIFVMEQGRIIERGAERDLLTADACYARLKRAWQDAVDRADDEI